MKKIDISKPEILMLLTEAFEREKRLRSYWVSKNADKILLAGTLTREPTNYFEQDVIRNTMAEGMATITRDHEIYACNKRKVPIRDVKFIPGIESIRHENSLINLGVGDAKEDPRLARPDTDLSPDPLMRPVDSKTKRILLKPKPKFGKEKYLNDRAKQIPEKRYYLPECTSWNYGWRISDSKMKHPTNYGRNLMLQKTLNNRVGPTRDPDHYNAVIKGTYEKCVPY